MEFTKRHKKIMASKDSRKFSRIRGQIWQRKVALGNLPGALLCLENIDIAKIRLKIVFSGFLVRGAEIYYCTI